MLIIPPRPTWRWTSQTMSNSRGSIRLSNSYQARTPFESKNTDSIPAGTMLKYNKAYFQADLSKADTATVKAWAPYGLS